jgi:hypothetical protein
MSLDRIFTSIQRNIADSVVDDRLLVLHAGALQLSTHVSGDPNWVNALDRLLEIAHAHGMLEKHVRWHVEHVLSEALKGRPSLWPVPDWSLLEDRRGTLPKFPINVLSAPWQKWVERASHGAGVTIDHVVVPLIGIASSLIGTARRVKSSRSWSEPMSIWTAVVGNSGTGKTPGIAVTQRMLAYIESDRRSKLTKLKQEHETRLEIARAKQKKWKKDLDDAVASGMPAPPCPDAAILPGEFVVPRLYVSDSTIEKIAILLQARPQGMLLLLDELAGLFLNMGRYSSGSDKEFWLQSWNGSSHVVERMGRAAVLLDHLLVGIVGGLQPDKLARSFEGDADGMYARICFAWPEEPSYRPLTNEVNEIEPEIVNALCRLIDLDTGAADNTFAPRNIELSDNARAVFEEFRRYLHDGKAALDGRDREWWAKGASHVMRLAGTLTYLFWSVISGASEPTEIDDSAMEASVNLWSEYFWPHARAALRQIGLTERHANARRVLRWIRTKDASTVSLMDIRRDALAQSLPAVDTEELLNRLASAGWLYKVTERTFGAGGKEGRSRHRWAVNPTLYAGCAGSAESSSSGNGKTHPAHPAHSAHDFELPKDLT